MRKGITLSEGMCSRSDAPEAEMEFGVQALCERSTSVRRRARKWDSTEGDVSLPPDHTKPQPMLQGALGCVLPHPGVWSNCSGLTIRNPGSVPGLPSVLEGMTWGEEPAWVLKMHMAGGCL